ncbi:hypothetical protein [Paenibacillus sp. AR247]|uniref:hypothetical protein n=1 Tax=Paenibacillus sp. AR247 TaxID=1631599 RepID=UPI000CF8A399|nr:hypothetical protein [Paenibacillus sp. AR247]PQP89672.1 hypothetical protein CPT76_16890 [Paenibacillus sp. AR247]
MDTAIWQQVAELKSKLLELACTLMSVPEEEFSREHAILDLYMFVEDVHKLEERCLENVVNRDLKTARMLADFKERLYKGANKSMDMK